MNQGSLCKLLMLPAILSILISIAAACGGGGGAGGGPRSSNEPGDISLWIEKGKSDTGDLNRVRVDIFDPNPSGVILKFRFPLSLRYSKGSAVLFPNEEDQKRITPSFEETHQGFRYLVFFLSDEELRYGEYSTLELNLKASIADPNALVAVDLDNNDPNIPDSREFDVKRPLFAPVEEIGIEIRGDPVAATGTPSPTPTKSSKK